MNTKYHVREDDILNQAPDFSDIPLPGDGDAPPEDPSGFTAEELAELQSQEAELISVTAGDVPSIRESFGLPPKPDAYVPSIYKQDYSKPKPEPESETETEIKTPSLPSFMSHKRQLFAQVDVGNGSPSWWDGKKINEVALAERFIALNPLRCINGQLYSLNGKLDSDDAVRNALYATIKPFVSTSLPSRVGTIVETVKRECSVAELDDDGQFIHLANGTYDVLSGEFTHETQVCRYRLPVNYLPDAGVPTKFLRFINQLFFAEDIETVQEFVGYCLLPYTIGQKMLLIIGRGGEGKSTFGGVLSALFGSASMNSSIHMLEASRFNMAELEDKLLMIDDDMKLDSLPSTSKLKTLVTAMDPVQVERKGVQPYLARLYCRVIGFGNYSLESFNDTSVGFFRRQIILRTRLPEKGRKTDPNLLTELKGELPGILSWALEGLDTLIREDFRFRISKRAKNNLSEVMLEANNIPEFLMTPFMRDDMITSQELYSGYVEWCNRNGDEPIIRKRFIKFVKENSERYGLRYSKNINVDGNIVRGFCRMMRQEE